MPACERSPGPFRLRENICSGQDFSCQDIDHTVLSGCRFELVDFSDALLEYCTFEACVFNACKLNGGLLKNCAFVNCTFPYSGFFAAEFHQCKMTGSSFAGASCAGVLIKGGDWSYTDLRELDFSRMRLSALRGRTYGSAALKTAPTAPAGLMVLSWQTPAFREATCATVPCAGWIFPRLN